MSDDWEPQRRGTTENTEPRFGEAPFQMLGLNPFFLSFFFLLEEKAQLWRGLGVGRGHTQGVISKRLDW